ncbi:MAG: CDP-alcohol phosphatidyltransferase family protein, partial [Anaerolineae bacterium]|nr:CDP-alcohol phosphatidyltransferase family protein [Anaerolineae bacterium]
MLSDLARKYSRSFLEPIARFISQTGVTPNVITITGFILMIGVALVLAQGNFFLGGWLIIAAAIFDALDGTLARMMGRTSRFGAFLDSTLDRFSEAVIFLGIFIHLSGQNQQLELILIYATVVGSLMVSYARARAEGIGVPLKDGLFTRFERILLLVIGLIFGLMTLTLWLLAIFSNLTAIQRMYLV